MPQAPVPLAFPTWRDVWASLDGIPELLAKADAVLSRRAAGNQRTPQWASSDGDETLVLGVHALRAWANGKPPSDLAMRPQIACRIHAIVQPALHAAAWPRWLLLERAFLDGSATGDLLFAALTLRTMCEEVQRLHALDLDSDEVAKLAASSAPADQERLTLFLSAAWVSLDTIPQDMMLEGTNWPSLIPIRAVIPAVESARSALNAYVHPNYGSHIAALFSERTGAARLLLEAIVAVYEAFFALSWSEQSVAGRAVPTGVSILDSWPRVVERFQSHILPEVWKTAGNPELAAVMKLPAIIKWLTTERADLERMLSDPAGEALLEGLPRKRKSSSADRTVSESFRMWEGARAIDVLNLASARRAEQLLAEEFPSGAPDSSDQTRWLRFNALSLGLAALLDQVKATAFKAQLIRQVSQGNGLGALLCVRSLIEHRALVVWLPREVGVSLDAMAGELQAARALPRNAADVEQPLANYLSTHATTSKENQRAWVLRESGDIRTARLNLGNIIEAAFPESDRFRTFYALASAAMHGRSMRGCELLVDAESRTKQACLVSLLVLERLCGRDEEMDHLSAAFRMSAQLDHAANFGGTSAAATDIMAKQVFGRIEGSLVQGVDYTGNGTTESPFQFGSHLEFHQASYALLEQLGVDVANCPCVLDHSAAGHFCDRWRAPDRDYWFQIAR